MPANLGDVVQLAGTFRATSTGAVQDPSVVKITIRRPSGRTDTYVYGTDAGVSRDSTGRYHYNLDVDVAGRYYYRWWSTGTGKAGIEKYVDVSDSKAAHPA